MGCTLRYGYRATCYGKKVQCSQESHSFESLAMPPSRQISLDRSHWLSVLQRQDGGQHPLYTRLCRPEQACRSMSSGDSTSSHLISAPTLRHHEAARPPAMINMAFALSLAQTSYIVNWIRQHQSIHSRSLSATSRVAVALIVCAPRTTSSLIDRWKSPNVKLH